MHVKSFVSGTEGTAHKPRPADCRQLGAQTSAFKLAFEGVGALPAKMEAQVNPAHLLAQPQQNYN